MNDDLTGAVLSATLQAERMQADALASALRGVLEWPDCPRARLSARLAVQAHELHVSLREYKLNHAITPPTLGAHLGGE